MSEKKEKGVIRDWIETIAISLALAMIVRTFVLQVFKIPTGSMLDTLLINDCIMANKFKYKIVDPKRGDIIIFKAPHEPQKDYIKRLIGIPGDKIEIRKKRVLVNDQYIDEPYKVNKDSYIEPEGYGWRDYFGPVIVPKDCYFVMGDNRDHSYDSRGWGFLPKSHLRGKAFLVYWPLTRIQLIK